MPDLGGTANAKKKSIGQRKRLPRHKIPRSQKKSPREPKERSPKKENVVPAGRK